MVRRRLASAAVAVGLAAGAMSGCAVGGSSSSGADATAAASTAAAATSVTDSPTASATPAAQAQRVGSVVPEPPRVIELPGGHKMAVRPVATTDNGLLDVPEDINAAGWWRGGSKIGDPFGSTLIAAHVDSFTQGIGPFSALLGVRSGDRVVVWSRGLRQIFRITSLRLRPRSTVIGADSSLHSPAGPRRLTLVTCAGPYVRSAGGYQNLAVVTALPVGNPTSRHAAS